MSLLPLIVAVPLLVAALLAAFSKLIPRALADGLGTGTAAGLAILAGMVAWHATHFGTIVYWFGDWRPRPGGIAIGIAFVADPLGASLAAFVGLLGTAAMVFSWRYFESVGALFHALMLVFLAAMAGFCLTGDLFTMFVFFELMGTAAFALTGHKIEAESLEGALNFAIINSLGAFLTLWGISLLYGRCGALNFAQLGRPVQALGPPDGLVIMAFALIACGFLVKAATVPFHFWLADAHAVAPTPVCLLFSGIMVELGLYGVTRVYWTVFAGASHWHLDKLRLVLLWLGVVSALVGAIMCWRQRHLKRLLAFSTISHAGIMLGAIVTTDAKELAGVLLYVFSHGAVKGALFLCTGILLHRLESVDQVALRGRGRIMPWTGTMFVLGGLGLAGLPPFGTCFGKGLMDEGIRTLGQGWTTWLFGLAAALTGGAVLRAAGWVFAGWGSEVSDEQNAPTDQERPETKPGSQRTPVSMLATAGTLLVLAIVLGLASTFHVWTQQAAGRFLDFKGYGAAVLDARSTGPPARATAGSIVFGIGTALTAVVIASLSLLKDYLPPVFHRAGKRLLEPPLSWLMGLHSGNVCDYAAWLTAGMAALAGLFTLALRH
jgi:multicomponent Na+:H+ antiporter subunit D